MDPVKFFAAEVTDMIFSFLDHSELNRCSYVSPDWNEAIKSSTTCMNNFYLALRGDLDEITENDKEVLTSRKYSNIIVSDGNKTFPFIYDVMNANSNWKHVKIYCTKFNTSMDLIRLFKTFESSVEHLEMQNVKIRNRENIHLKFDMKKLKFLSITNTDESIATSVLHNCKNLVSLTLGYPRKEKEMKNIFESFKGCKSLKNLYTSGHWFQVMFADGFESMKFHLKDLSVMNDLFFDQPDLSISLEQNFTNFLETQSESLVNLHLGGIFGLQTLVKVLTLPKLEELVAPYFVTPDWYLTEFPVSVSLKVLDAVSIDLRSFEFFEKLIKTVPNLKRLRSVHLDQDKAISIAENMVHLEHISLVTSHQKILELYLPKIKWELQAMR